MRFFVAALALFVTPALIAPTACAQNVATQVESALLAKVDPALQPCLAELVGLTISVPEGFADNQHLVAPEGADDDLELVLCSYVDVVAEEVRRYFHVVARPHLDVQEQIAFLRGDYLDANDAATLTPTSAPALNVEVTRAYERTLENGDLHDMVVLGCEDGVCYRLDMVVPGGTGREALVDVLRGVRFEG
ncbi:MAG: hypothetical protein AAFX41_06450 [Bacteroidota bacterium]